MDYHRKRDGRIADVQAQGRGDQFLMTIATRVRPKGLDARSKFKCANFRRPA